MTAQGTAGKAGTRFDALDGLRGLAAAFVVLHHGLSAFAAEKQWVPHAQLAVDFFFGLSGFVVGSAYEGRLQAGMGFSRFAVQRLIRLYPLMLAGLTLGAMVQLLRASSFGPGIEPMRLLAAFVANVLWLPDPVALAKQSGSLWPLNVALWSLSTELLLSLSLGLWLYRWPRPWLGWALWPAAACTVGLVVTLGGVGGGHDSATWWAGPVRGVYPFVAGLWLWRLYAADAPALHGAQRLGAVPGLTAALLLAMLLWPAAGQWKAVYELCAVVLAVPLTVAMGAHARPGPRMVRLCQALGRWSFPLYALHYPVVQLASAAGRRWHLDSGPPLLALVMGELALSVALAAVAARYLDEPVRAWLQRRWSAARPVRTASTVDPASAGRQLN